LLREVAVTVRVLSKPYRSDAVIPAAMRLAIAASVQCGRALRAARRARAFARFAILASPTLGALASEVR
jgi:hypothetical protein